MNQFFYSVYRLSIIVVILCALAILPAIVLNMPKLVAYAMCVMGTVGFVGPLLGSMYDPTQD